MAKKNNETLSYSEAYNALQEIVTLLENAEVNIDELSSHLKKAGEYLKICKAKLADTEEEVSEILHGLDN